MFEALEPSSWWRAAGEAIGGLIGAVARLLAGLWRSLADGVGALLSGISRGIGLEDPTLVTWAVLALGLVLAMYAIRRLFRRAVVSGLLLLALSGLLISTVVV